MSALSLLSPARSRGRKGPAKRPATTAIGWFPVTNPGGLIGEVVVAGKAELAIQQIPELMAVPGIDLVGPLPQEFQNISVLTAGIFAGSRQAVAAQALLEFFATPTSARVFRANGLEPA